MQQCNDYDEGETELKRGWKQYNNANKVNYHPISFTPQFLLCITCFSAL